MNFRSCSCSGNLSFCFLVVVRTSKLVRKGFVTRRRRPMISMAKVLLPHHHLITICFVRKLRPNTLRTVLLLLWCQLNWKITQSYRPYRIIPADDLARKAYGLETGLPSMEEGLYSTNLYILQHRRRHLLHRRQDQAEKVGRNRITRRTKISHSYIHLLTTLATPSVGKEVPNCKINS